MVFGQKHLWYEQQAPFRTRKSSYLLPPASPPLMVYIGILVLIWTLAGIGSARQYGSCFGRSMRSKHIHTICWNIQRYMNWQCIQIYRHISKLYARFLISSIISVERLGMNSNQISNGYQTICCCTMSNQAYVKQGFCQRLRSERELFQCEMDSNIQRCSLPLDRE